MFNIFHFREIVKQQEDSAVLVDILSFNIRYELVITDKLRSINSLSIT